MAALEMTNAAELMMDLIVTVSGVALDAVKLRLGALAVAVLAVKGVVVVCGLVFPAPVMVIAWVRAVVVAAVTVVLPLVVSAMIVEERPVPLTQGLPTWWQWTQKVGLVEALYWVVPRLGDAATPLMVTLERRPSWL